MNSFYVYRYIRLDTKTPFYVGKGRLNRSKRISHHNEYCKRIIAAHGCKIEHMVEGLAESEAYAKELEFLKMYKTMGYCEANFAEGGRGGASGKYITLETKQKISAAKKGIKFTEAHKAKISTAQKLIKHKKGIFPGVETRRKMSASRKNNSFAKKREIVDIVTGQIWKSIKSAAAECGLKRTTFWMQLNGYNPHKTNLRYKIEV